MIIRDNKKSIQKVINNLNEFYNEFDPEVISDVITCSAGLDFVIEKNKIYFADSSGNKITKENFEELILEYNIDFIQSSASVDNYMYSIESIFSELESILEEVFELDINNFLSCPLEPRSVLDFQDSYFDKHPFSKVDLIRYTNYRDLNQIYDSINITNIRAIDTYKKILIILKQNIKKNKKLVNFMENEDYSNVHFSDKYLSLLITNCIISLCSILDLIGKIIGFIEILKHNGNEVIILEKLIHKKTSYQNIKKIDKLKTIIEMPIFKALIEIRNDIIHNSSTIDIEKHYYIDMIHFDNGEKIYLANIFFRDTKINGTVITNYGNKYLINYETRLDLFLSSSIKNIEYLIKKFQVFLLDKNTYKT